MNDFPANLSRYFWDADSSTIDLSRHAPAVIARLLNYGDTEAIRWLNRAYTKTQIQTVIRNRRELIGKAARYWSKFYDIPEKEVLCLQPEFQKTRSKIWNH